MARGSVLSGRRPRCAWYVSVPECTLRITRAERQPPSLVFPCPLLTEGGFQFLDLSPGPCVLTLGPCSLGLVRGWSKTSRVENGVTLVTVIVEVAKLGKCEEPPSTATWRWLAGDSAGTEEGRGKRWGEVDSSRWCWRIWTQPCLKPEIAPGSFSHVN